MSLSKLQEFYTPEDSKAVVELLGKFQDNALIVAGGTFVHGLIARGLLDEIEALIDIHKLGLNYIKTESGKLRIGATTTFAELVASNEIANSPALGAIADAMTYPPTQVKNSATIGGCIAASCPFFDLPVSFLALGGSVKAQGPKGERNIALDDFFTGLFDSSLAADEFVTELEIPLPDSKSASAFMKLETNANDLAILNAAVSITLDGSGKCMDSRIYIGGGVGETPVRASSAEALIKGQKLDEQLCLKAGEAAKSDIDPLTDHRATAAYRSAIARVFVERCLKQSLSRLNQQ